MSNQVSIAKTEAASFAQIEQVLVRGDLATLNEKQRVMYYNAVCESIGLNPLTKPFDYITLNGRLVLYAKRDATDQLRKRHGVSVSIVSREKIDDVYVVTARAKLADGREDESTGAVHLGNLKGEMLANAMMKAETKAKRRVTLSICGLGLLDETEVDDIPAKAKNPITAGEPGPEDGVPRNAGYRIPFGKYAKRSLEEIDLGDLRSYVVYLEQKAEESGKPLGGQVKEFVELASAHIAAFENAPIDGEPA